MNGTLLTFGRPVIWDGIRRGLSQPLTLRDGDGNEYPYEVHLAQKGVGDEEDVHFVWEAWITLDGVLIWENDDTAASMAEAYTDIVWKGFRGYMGKFDRSFGYNNRAEAFIGLEIVLHAWHMSLA